MTRLLFALVFLAGCGTAPSGLSPDDAYDAAITAIRDGRVPQALALLHESAEAGHLGALQLRARAYAAGYLRTDWVDGWEPGRIAGSHPFLVLPGQADEMRDAYRHALVAASDAGDTDAMFTLAYQLGQPQWIDGEWTTPPADRDSARALFGRLAALDLTARPGGADLYRLAMLAGTLDDADARRHYLRLASDAGSAPACWFALWTDPNRPNLATTAGFSDYVDAAEACPRPDDGSDPVGDDLRALVAQTRAGNAVAGSLVDSLRLSGLFERHSRLAAVVGEPEGSSGKAGA